MADHPLRPATHRRLGRPLPYQQANGPRAPPGATQSRRKAPSVMESYRNHDISGISHRFQWLSPTPGQVTHVLLTRSPLYSPPEGDFRARLACMRHAASVRPEPGSNSPLYISGLGDKFPEDSIRLKRIGRDLLILVTKAIQFSKIKNTEICKEK